MEYQKTFDEELAAILTDYGNQSWIDPETGLPMAPIDISKGSMVFIKGAVLASAKWGLHKHQAWIARQIFPDACDSEKLEHHCWLRGINRNAGETDEALLARLLADLRDPPAGGNAADYARWAGQVQGVATAWCVPMGNGIGTVDVLILADALLTGSAVPGPALLAAVHAYIIARCPCEMHPDDLRILAPGIIAQDVTMSIPGVAADPAEIAADISAFISAMAPGQSLYLSRLSAFAVAAGEENATIITPQANVVPGVNQVIRPGVITVSAE
ncbi:MAG: baseplate J/gp47 family protein [Desulfobacteraceae bacterium]|nr:baseplate J/gp47 family protein [Desulfobacteraceae bacterium]